MKMDEHVATEVSSTPVEGILAGYISQVELAKELGIARKTLDRWRLEGHGPQRAKIGKKVFYKKSAVEAWLESLSAPEAVKLRRSRAGVKGQREYAAAHK